MVWATKLLISFNENPPLIKGKLLFDNEGADAGEGIEELLLDLDSIKNGNNCTLITVFACGISES